MMAVADRNTNVPAQEDAGQLSGEVSDTETHVPAPTPRMHGRNDGETSASDMAPNKAPIGVDRTTAMMPSLQDTHQSTRRLRKAYKLRLEEAFPVTRVLSTNPVQNER